MEPTTVLPIISLLSLVSVEYGGWALLGFLTGRGQIGEFREQFFRAGHAHAGDRASGLRGSSPGPQLDVSTPASVGTTNFFESQNIGTSVPVVDGRSHQFWSYSSCRRIQSWKDPSSSRPFGARSRIG
jgi:hypothetical protein